MTHDPFTALGRRLAQLLHERVREVVETERTDFERLAGELEERAKRLEGQIKTLSERDRSSPGERASRQHAQGGLDLPSRTQKEVKPAVPKKQGRAKPARRVTSGPFNLTSHLQESGLTVIDKRSIPGGNLWVVGDTSVANVILEELAAEGIDFIFVPSGSRATGGKPGWYTKSPK